MTVCIKYEISVVNSIFNKISFPQYLVAEISSVAMLAIKRLAGATLDMNLRKHVTCMPPQSINEAGHSGFKPRDVTRNSKQGYQ